MFGAAPRRQRACHIALYHNNHATVLLVYANGGVHLRNSLSRWSPTRRATRAGMLGALALLLVMPLLLAETHSDGTSWKLYSIAKGPWQVVMGTGLGRRATCSPNDPESASRKWRGG